MMVGPLWQFFDGFDSCLCCIEIKKSANLLRDLTVNEHVTPNKVITCKRV